MGLLLLVGGVLLHLLLMLGGALLFRHAVTADDLLQHLDFQHDDGEVARRTRRHKTRHFGEFSELCDCYAGFTLAASSHARVSAQFGMV